MGTLQLNYQSYGKGHPLIVLHGLFGMLDNWHSVGRMLGRDFRVFVLDQRNHGHSPHLAEMNYKVLAQDVRDFALQLHITSCYLLGHSMGGKVAMEAALRYPNLVDKLVVVDIAPRLYPSFHDAILEALTSLDLTAYKSRSDIDRALSTKIAELPVRQFLMKNLARNEDGSYRWKMNLAVIAQHYPELLQEIDSTVPFTKPVLFVRSLRSSYIGDKDIPEIHRLFPKSSFADFDTGHWVHAESPDGLIKTVTAFLLREKN